MAHVVKLRVKDTTASTGTGSKVLARTSALNFRTFDAVMANGDTCDAIVVNRSANQWEHSSWTIAGVGSEPVLTRLEFKESSTGTPVNFSEGTKDVLMLYPVAGKLDFTARTLRLAPNIIDAVPGTVSTFRFYDDGAGWIGGIGISGGSVDYRSGTNHTWFVGAGPTQVARLNNTGLGLGTASVNAKLHVYAGADTGAVAIFAGLSNAVRIGMLGFTPSIEGVDVTGVTAHRNLFIGGGDLLLGGYGSEKVRINGATGNVGIGTATPDTKLDVMGTTVGATENIVRIGNAGASRYMRLGVYLSGNQYPFIQGYHTNNDALYWKLLLNPYGSEVGINGVPADGVTLDVVGNPGFAHIRAINYGTAGAQARIKITTGGRTVSQIVDYNDQFLHEVGDSVMTKYSDFDTQVWRTNAGADRMRLNSNGLGIGRSPGAPFDVWPSTIDTGYTYVARFGVYNNVGLSTHTRMLLGQLSTNAMFFEVADQTNTKGVLHLQPFGGAVIVGYPFAIDRGQFSVQASVAGNLLSLIHNDMPHVDAHAEHRMYVGGKYTRRLVSYGGSHLHENGFGVTGRYSDFDTHYWRNSAGVETMRLAGGALSIGGSPSIYKLDVIYSQASSGDVRVANGSLDNAAGAALLVDLSSVPWAYGGFRIRKNVANPVVELTTGLGVAGGVIIQGIGVAITNLANQLWMKVENSGQVYLANTSDPGINPGSGGYLFVVGGALKWRGSAGTVTTIANA